MLSRTLVHDSRTQDLWEQIIPATIRNRFVLRSQILAMRALIFPIDIIGSGLAKLSLFAALHC